MGFWTLSSQLSLKGHIVRKECSCAPWRVEFSVAILFVIPLHFLVQIYSVPICLVFLLNKTSNKRVQVDIIFLLVVSGNVSLVPVARRAFWSPSFLLFLWEQNSPWDWSSHQWWQLAMAGGCSGVVALQTLGCRGAGLGHAAPCLRGVQRLMEHRYGPDDSDCSNSSNPPLNAWHEELAFSPYSDEWTQNVSVPYWLCCIMSCKTPRD